MTTASSMQAITLMAPRHSRHVSMSILTNEADELKNPAHIGLFGSNGVVRVP
jgi:hypothetical protein